MPRHTFIQHSKLTDVKGRIDYISNPKRQEHLYVTYTTVIDPKFWDYLAGQNQNDFRKSGAAGSCIEARELIIALPEELQKYDHEKLLELFVQKFKMVYGVDAVAALHHNKAMTNFHIHLIISERKPMAHTEVKRASRNMFYDEHGRHVRTKKEILDENGEVRKGCFIVAKGEPYDIRYFQPKEKIFKSRQFTADIKEMFTDFINELVTDEKNRLTVFSQDGPYLATKKIGKNNPREAEIRADNAVRQKWNQTVDEAIVAGIPEEKIREVRDQNIREPIRESAQRYGFRPDLLAEILRKAVDVLARMIRRIPVLQSHAPAFDEKTFLQMRKVKEELDRQNQVVGCQHLLVDKARKRMEELQKPKNIFKKKQREQALKDLASAQFNWDNAQRELNRIVKRVGYRDVAAFNKAYEKACRIIEDSQKDGMVEPTRRESVIVKLHQYDQEAKSRKAYSELKEKEQLMI